MRCSECKRNAEVLLSVSRYGGGNYRRGGRWYRTSICVACGQRALTYRDETIADGRNPGRRYSGIEYGAIERELARVNANSGD